MTYGLIRFWNAVSIKSYVVLWVACVFILCGVVAAGGWLAERQYSEAIRQAQAHNPARSYQAELALHAPHERWWIALMVVLALSLGAGFSGIMLRVVRPIGELRRAAARLDAGDYSARASAARDDEIGVLCGALNGLADTIVSNLAEQRRTEKELRSLALFPDENPYPVMRNSKDGTVLYANKAAVALLNVWNCEVGAAAPAVLQAEVKEALTANRSRESKIRCGNRVFSFVFTPIADRGYANLYGRDITARERMVEALVRSRDELERRVEERTAELHAANQALQADALAQGRMENTLRESEARFRSMFEDAPIGMTIVSPDHRILHANRAHCKFLGYSEQELAGFSVLDVTYPEDREDSSKVILRMHEGGPRIDRYQKRYVRKDGEVVWGEVSVSIIRDAYGKLIHTIAQIMDITERRRAEEALRENAKTIRALLNATTDKVFLLDTAGVILAVNETSARAWGRSVEQLTGACVYDFLTPSVTEPRKAHFARCVQSGQPVRFEDEHRGVWYDTIAYPIRDAQGKVTRMAVFGRDVTERKRADEALRQSEQRYRELFEASPTALIEEDWAAVRRRADQVRAEGVSDVRAWFLGHPEEALRCFNHIQRLDVNKAALRLFKAADKKELLANLSRLSCDESRDTAISAIAALAVGDEFFEAETSLQTLTGEKRNLLMSISSAPAAGKSLPRSIVSLSDVTDLRKAQQEAIEQRQAAQLQRMESLAVTGRLAAGVAHEINNPLQGIVGQLSLLAEELPEPLRQGRRIELIQGGIDRIAGIVRNLLQLHRPSSAGDESCAASSVIPDLTDLISSMTTDQRIRLEVSVSPPEMTIPMSANALMQVLLNLVLNAMDAMPQGGVMRIEARRTFEAALVSVSDTGVGIPPENRTRLFSPFFTTKGPKGTGLGLSVTHSLVTSAGGTIAVNDRKGGGTTFAIRFESSS